MVAAERRHLDLAQALETIKQAEPSPSSSSRGQRRPKASRLGAENTLVSGLHDVPGAEGSRIVICLTSPRPIICCRSAWP